VEYNIFKVKPCDLNLLKMLEIVRVKFQFLRNMLTRFLITMSLIPLSMVFSPNKILDSSRSYMKG